MNVFIYALLQILSMIEEAAGTRLYESKKESAEKIMAKKDAKLNEIDRVGSLLQQVVKPKGVYMARFSILLSPIE